MFIHWIALFIALVLNATANLLIKAGMRSMVAANPGGLLADGAMQGVLKILTSPLLMLGLFCFAANVLFYMYALQKIAISVGYPIMTTLGFLIILLVAAIQFREELTLWQWLGVGLIIAGVWLVAMQADRQLQAQPAGTTVVETRHP